MLHNIHKNFGKHCILSMLWIHVILNKWMDLQAWNHGQDICCKVLLYNSLSFKKTFLAGLLTIRNPTCTNHSILLQIVDQILLLLYSTCTTFYNDYLGIFVITKCKTIHSTTGI